MAGDGGAGTQKEDNVMSFLIMLTLLRDLFGELLGHPFFKK
jgi:hypothetical protein